MATIQGEIYQMTDGSGLKPRFPRTVVEAVYGLKSHFDWFIPESYVEDGETKFRLKLNPKYEGMYAEGWVSAGGVSDTGGGGGVVGYLKDLLDVDDDLNPSADQALVWNATLQKWVSGDVSVDLTPFERTANRVTTVSSSSNHTQYPTAKAVWDAMSGYLPLAGGTMANANVVTNLNADLLDGTHKSGLLTAFSSASGDSPNTSVTVGGTTKAVKVNADMLDGKHLREIEKPLATGIASVAARVGSLEDWLANPWLEELTAYDLHVVNDIDGSILRHEGKRLAEIELPLATGIARVSARVGSIEDWLVNPWLEELTAYNLSIGDVIRIGGCEIRWDSANGALRFTSALYSDSFVSAGGLSDMGGAGGSSYLKDLLDVDDALAPTSGQMLIYDGEKWVAGTRRINGIDLTTDIDLSLGNLSNVSVSGATDGQQLIYSGGTWIAGNSSGAKFFHGTCSTSSSSNNRVVDCASFTSTDLVAGTAIAIVMYNRADTTSAMTINVNGTGAKTLFAGFANRKAWSAGETILAVYSGTQWDMMPTWYYTYYYGGGGSGSGGGTGSTVVVTPRLSSGTRIATITVDGSGTDLYAPSVSVSQTQGGTGGTRIASVNSTAIYAPTVTVTQVQTAGVEVARIKVGSANPVSIFAPSGSGGASGVQTVVGKTGDVTTAQIADALTNAGYKLTDTVVDTSSFLPLSAGSEKALTGDLYTRAILPTASNTYDLGSSSKYFKNNYMKRIYLADGVYIEYDSTNRCVYVHGAGIATDSFVTAGGVSAT